MIRCFLWHYILCLRKLKNIMAKKKITKSEHDAGKAPESKNSSKKIKEFAGKILEQKAQINKLKKKAKKS